MVQGYSSSNMGGAGELILTRRAGGSIIEHRPIFSSDSRFLFVLWGPSVRAYSVKTGELVCVYEGLSEDAVGVCLRPDEPGKLCAMSCSGEIVEWEYQVRSSAYRKICLKLKKGTSVSSFRLMRSSNNMYSVVAQVADPQKKESVIMLFSGETGEKVNSQGNLKVDNHTHSFDAIQNGECTLIAGIKQTSFFVFFEYQGNKSEFRTRRVQNALTCISCHPSEHCVITGDIIGSISVWRNLHREVPVSAVYHWHTLPVQDVAFSQTGTSFYSVGGECVLVKWLLDHPRERRYLPRLSAEINHLAVSHEIPYTAVCTMDNAIHLIGPQFRVLTTIQDFSWARNRCSKGDVLPAGITTDPRSKSLVMNGRVGHIQFFSLHQMSLLYVLNITSCNYLTQERSAEIVNPDVVKIAFNSDGKWLATVEHYSDGVVAEELRLKFWEFNIVTQKYGLSTCIEYPHRGKINSLKFRPSNDKLNELCVTTSDDEKFQTWTLDKGCSCVWNCESVGFYRNLPAKALSFSTDGSLMGITFGPTLTLWEPDTNQLKCSLTQATFRSDLSHVEFGCKNCVHLVVAASPTGIAVWNLLSLSLVWTVPLTVRMLTADLLSEFMAIITTENHVVVFSPNNPNPIFKQCSLASSGTNIVTAAFVPHIQDAVNSEVPWQSKSQLYFVNTKMELLCLEHPVAEPEAADPSDVCPERLSAKQLTPFGAFLAEQSRSTVKELSKERHVLLGIPGFKTLKQLVESPAHTMPAISLLCQPVLLSLISSQRVDSSTKPTSEYDEESEIDEDDSGVDSAGEQAISSPRSDQKKQSASEKNICVTLPQWSPDLDDCLTPVLQKPLDWVSELFL